MRYTIQKTGLFLCSVMILATAISACNSHQATISPTDSEPAITQTTWVTSTTTITTTAETGLSDIPISPAPQEPPETTIPTTATPTTEPQKTGTTVSPTTTPVQGNADSGYIVSQELVFNDSTLEVYHITYMSDGLKVKGYLAQPKASGKYPAIIYNRGGNLDFGALTAVTLQRFARMGFVTIGSQYRGNDGGEGREEFGGEDINDVMNLIPVLKTMPNVDSTKISMVGYSRGGMMTYLALKMQTINGTDDIKAACTVGGTSDLFINGEARPEMNTVFKTLIGGTPEQLPEQFKARSATYWADMINTPLLIQHGEADWRVLPEESTKLASELTKYGKEYQLITYPGDDHSLSLHNSGLYEIFSWLARYLDVSVNLNMVARETPNNTIEVPPGEISGNCFIQATKEYQISYIPTGWRVNIPSAPLDIQMVSNVGPMGWAGAGAFSQYANSNLSTVNQVWFQAITKSSTDATIIEEDDAVIDGCQARSVTFQHTVNGVCWQETTYHILRPGGPFTMYRIRLTCHLNSVSQFASIFSEIVESFSFIE